MAITALQLEGVRIYESKYDPARGTSEATKFHLGTLDSRIAGRLRDMATQFVVDPNALDDEVCTSVNFSEVNFQTVQYGVRNIEGFKDEDGNDIPFATNKRTHGGKHYVVVADEVMKRIPSAVITELAEQIKTKNELTEGTAKN